MLNIRNKRRKQQWVFTTGSGQTDGEILSLKGTRAQAERLARQIQKQNVFDCVRIYCYDFYEFEIVGRALSGIKNGKVVIMVEWED